MLKEPILLFLFLFLFVKSAESVCCTTTYWVDYINGKLPENAYQVYKKNGKSVYIAQILQNGVFIGEFFEDKPKIYTAQNIGTPSNTAMKVFCVREKEKIFWKKTTNDTFKNSILGTEPVVGGVFKQEPLYVGKYVDGDEELVGNVYKGQLLTTKGVKREFSVLVERC